MSLLLPLCEIFRVLQFYLSGERLDKLLRLG